ncbi:MAG: glycerol-3-phosphate 1-O-acyltransferase PlsY [Chloroflexota bacterium]
MGDQITLNVIAVAIAYLLGSIPPAYIVAKLRKGIDIREVGSHNLGAMNVFYNVGFWSGIAVLALDIGKGTLALALARIIGVIGWGEFFPAIAVVLGHAFPVFLKFKGGKGGATTIGVLLFLLPWGAPFYLVIFGLLMLLTRFPTLSYSLAFLGFILPAWFIYRSSRLLAFAIVLLAIPGLRYVPRIVEMRRKAGSWRRVILRKNLKERF